MVSMTLDELRRELRALDKSSQWIQDQLHRYAHRTYKLHERLKSDGLHVYHFDTLAEAIKDKVGEINQHAAEASCVFRGYDVEYLRRVIDPEARRRRGER